MKEFAAKALCLKGQAVFIKMSTGGPQYDLSGFHCLGTTEADAYTSERYLGNILRYLKLGYNGKPVRFPKLHQVFVSSRTYGGYAQVPAHDSYSGVVDHGCRTYLVIRISACQL